MNRKTILRITFSVLVVVAVVGILVAYVGWKMSQPMYVVGSVQAESNLRSPLQPPQQKDPDRWQVSSDTSLGFDRYGEGKPVLVIHGGPGIPYAECWKGLEPLRSDYQFLFYDQRGCGRSTRPIDTLDGDFYSNMVQLEHTLGIGAQVADIERIRRILGEEKLTLIGHSFGGFIAAMYAAEFPERVEKLILIAPAGVLTPPNDETDIFTQTKQRLPEELKGDFDLALQEYLNFEDIFNRNDSQIAESHQEIGKYILTAMGYDPEAFRSEVQSGGWSVFAMYFSLGRKPNFLSALDNIKADTLILQGADDVMTETGAQAYRVIPNSKYVVITNPDGFAGHFVFDDAPEQFATATGKALSE